MSVSYHLIPVDKQTGATIQQDGTMPKLKNDFSIFAALVIQYPDRFIGYFEKHELYFDFILCLRRLEKSTIIYQPNLLKSLFQELLGLLATKDGFPIPAFNYFRFEDTLDFKFLYANLQGSELNKIVEDKVYFKDSSFEIAASFDPWNNYTETAQGGGFKQVNPIISIKTEEGNMFKSAMDLRAFPSELAINHASALMGIGKDAKQVSLVLKTPYEHLSPIFNDLIEVCDYCMERGYGLKSFISC